MRKRVVAEDQRVNLMENEPGFKSRIDKAYAEYKAYGGICAGALIRKMEKKRGTKKHKVKSCPS